MASRDLSSKECLTLDSSDAGDEVVIDIGSPSSEKGGAVNKTPGSGRRKRSLDEQATQSECKVSTQVH